MTDYDAIVVGAGPGGSSAAYFLARGGARVLVLERKQFPRAKVCGDGLTPRSVKILEEVGMGAELATYSRVRGLRVRGAGRTLELDFPKLSNFCDYGLVRPRKDLDAEIAGRARAAGAQFRMGVEAVAPVYGSGAVAGVRWVRRQRTEDGGVITLDEGEVTAPFILIADGASSPFGRALGVRRLQGYPLGLAIRTYYQSPLTTDDRWESWLRLRKGKDMLPGYGWIFPVGDGTVNAGVGLLSTFGRWRDVNLNHLQRAFVDMLPRDYGINHETQVSKYQSGRLPMGGSISKPYGPGYLLIGDAAGMVNPFNGEGIAYALETAKLTAGLVLAALRNGSTNELAEYREALHDIYGAYYRMGRAFVKIIGHPRAFQTFVAIGLQFKPLMSFVFQALGNLTEEEGGRLGDRTFRALRHFAEFELPALNEPEIPLPFAPAKQKAGDV